MGAIKMRAAARILTSTNGIFSKTAFIASTELFGNNRTQPSATDEMKGIGNS
jgi:hypothetical protein